MNTFLTSFGQKWDNSMWRDANIDATNTVSIETSTGIAENMTLAFTLVPNAQISNTLHENFTLKWAQNPFVRSQTTANQGEKRENLKK